MNTVTRLRSGLATAIAVAAVLGAGGTAHAAGGGVATDWPQYRADAAHTGVVAAQPGLDPVNVAQRGLALTAAVPLGSGAADASAAGGTAFTTGGFVAAADIASGTLRWTSDGVNAAFGPLSISHGVVLAPGESDALLYGLDPATGAVRWRYPPAAPSPFEVPVTPPTVDAAGQAAYLVTELSDGPTLFTLRSVGVAAGTPRWSAPLPADVTRGPFTVSSATPTAAGGRILLATEQGRPGSVFSSAVFSSALTAYSAGTGQPLWSVTTSPASASSGGVPTVAVAGGLVYTVGADGSLAAYDVATGARRWRSAVGASARSAPAVVGPLVLIGRPDGRLVALDAASGQVRWQAAVGTTDVSAPAVAGGVAWVTVDNTLVAVRSATGQVLRRTAVNSTVFARDPVVANDRILVVAQFADQAVLQIYGPA